MSRGLSRLEPGEQLLSRAAASFRGATATSARASFMLGSARTRRDAYDVWRMQAEAVGFPAAGPEMVLAITNARIVVYRTSFWLGRPADLSGSVPLERVADVATTRHGIVTGLAIALTNGHIVEVEALRGRHLHRFADALATALDGVQR